MGSFGFWRRLWIKRVLLLAGAIAAANVVLVVVVISAVELGFLAKLDVLLHPAEPTTRIASSEAAPAWFGATYRILPSQIAPKAREFDAIRDPSGPAQWDASTTQMLSRGLLERSILENSRSGAPDARSYQRYNYVVKDGSIRVAVWTRTSNIKGMCKSALKPTDPTAKPSAEYENATVTKDVMVNFFPEDKSAPGGPLGTKGEGNVCHVKTPKETGVLDAHGKHFMLAQDVAVQQGSSKLASLQDYLANTSTEAWLMATVDYAGEIVVDVAACSYIVNNGSGTYRPNAGSGGDFAYLLRVAKLFKEKVGVSPVGVWDASPRVIVPTTNIPGSGTPLRCR